MKRAALLLAMTLALASTARADEEDFRTHAPPAAARATFTPPAIREARLANGIRVLVVPRPGLPIVTLRAVASYGAANAAAGVAGFAAEAARYAAGSYTSWELHKAVTSIGAEFTSRVTADGVDLGVKCVTPRLDAAAELLAAMAYEPAFASADVDRVRGRRQRDRLDVTRTSSTLFVAGALYPADHPLHDRMWGSDHAIASIDVDALRAYWRAAWVPSQMTLVASGDVSLDMLLPVLERTFGTRKSAPPPAKSAVAAPPQSARAAVLLIARGAVSQSTITAGALVPGVGSPDYVPLLVATAAVRARLYADLREHRDITYDVDVSIDPAASIGELTLEASVETPETAESLTRMLAELDRLSKERLTDEWLAKAKSRLQLRLPAQLETTGGTARALALVAVAGQPADAWQVRQLRIAEVTAEDVQRVATRYMQSANMQVVIAGDAQRVAPQLAVAGVGAVRLVR